MVEYSFGGYMGHMLRVNLTTRKITREELKAEYAKKYVGGSGIGGRILYEEVPAWVGALDPQNLLIFSTGPATGTNVPTAGRHTVVTKSPLTGYFGDASGGGYWGATLKFSGYDMLVFTGRSDKPLMLYVDHGEPKLMSAESYWGTDARESDRAIRNDIGRKDARVATIGKAGEKLVRYAAIMNDEADRAAARCGVGAVMGFMKLKAVAVVGDRKVPVRDEKAAAAIYKEVATHVKVHPEKISFSKGGTPGYLAEAWELGDAPAYNWGRSEFGGPGNPGIERLAWPGGYEQILAGTRSCYLCPIACRRVSRVDDGKYRIEPNVEGPEYETQAALGPNCGIDNVKALAKLNDLCNLYGMDTISLGGTLAFAMECFEKGLISKQDTGGIELKFGNADAAIEMTHRIASREGLGNILAEGSRRAAQIIGKGAEEYAIQVKGMEMAMHDPRAFQGGGPHYACTPTGGRHTEGITMGLELHGGREVLGYPNPMDRFSTQGKGLAAKVVEDWWTAISIMGWCIYADPAWGYPSEELLLRSYTAITGIPLTFQDALKAGERVFNLKKAFNVKHGATRAEDTLPKRLLTQPGRSGAVVKLDETLPEYYEARGWDPATSKPKVEKLLELGLEDVGKDIWG
jgi:aldehyde:ferredoxin oxidoreductase